MSDVSYRNSGRARFSSPAALRLPQRAIAATDSYVSTVTRDDPLDISPLQSELVVYGRARQGFFCNETVDGLWTSEPITQWPLTLCSGSVALNCMQTQMASSDTMVALLYVGEGTGTVSGITAGMISGTITLVSAPSSVVEHICGWRQ
jgi:hypothetical protein